MLYNIDGKIYIRASGYYKEVIVKINPRDKKDYIVDIVKGGDKIEAKHDEMKPVVTLERAFRMTSGKDKELEIN